MSTTRFFNHPATPDGWYSTTQIFDHIEYLQKLNPKIKVVPDTSLTKAPKGPETFANYWMFVPVISSSESAKNPNSKYAPEILVPKIQTLVAFLKQLPKPPQHVRIGIHINGNHFVAADLEFTEDQIKFSYLNTLNGYKPYDDVICKTFNHELTKYFWPNKTITRALVIDNIQLNTKDCGMMLVEWFSIGTATMKITTQKNTPYEELTSHGAVYFYIAGLHSDEIRDDHQSRIANNTAKNQAIPAVKSADTKKEPREIIIIDDDDDDTVQIHAKKYKKS